MKSAKYMHLLLLSLLLTIFAGCKGRDGMDDYLLSEVEIKLNWTGVTDKLPETMRVIFYSKSEEGHRIESYLPPAGGEVKVPPGRYAVVIYNYNTESVLIRGDESYETIEAYTGRCTGLNIKEEMVWSPDPLYVVALDDVDIEKSDDVFLMEYKPEAVVKNYSFDIKIVGVSNLSGAVCSVSGLSSYYSLGKRTCASGEVPVNTEVVIKDGVLWGSFSQFKLSEGVKSRSLAPFMLTLKLIKTDHTVQEVKVDITELLVPPSSGGGGEKPNEDVHIEVPVPGGEIEVEKPEPTPGGGDDDGGIGGDVGDWGDEDNVELPA
jgi:Domain of unknown function (DUF5119)